MVSGMVTRMVADMVVGMVAGMISIVLYKLLISILLNFLSGMILLPASMQQRGDFDVVVTATGLVGPSSIVTKTHTFVQSIDRGSVNIVRTPDISEANTADTSFCVTAGVASHLTYAYEFGDGATDDTTTSTLPEDATPVCTTHQFGVGTFTTTLTLSNVAGSEIFTVDIESLQPLGTVTANYNTDYDLSSGSFELVIDLTSDSPAIPTAVHCDVAFKDGLSAVDHLLTGKSFLTSSFGMTTLLICLVIFLSTMVIVHHVSSIIYTQL